MRSLPSPFRLVLGLLFIGTLVVILVPILLVLLPWRTRRIRVTNAFGTLIGRGVMWCSGCRVTIRGAEHLDPSRPAIYAGNHTSILDAFTTIWLTPSGTVGVAKKEVFYYPFYGQAWWLAGHVFVDRARTEKAKAALRETARFLRDNRLSLCILPEGTRSESGRLLPFKKGIVHMAIETKLPIVPMVTEGLAGAWRKGSLTLRPQDVTITFYPPVDTSTWTEESVETHLEDLREVFVRALSEHASSPPPRALAAFTHHTRR